MLEVEVDTATAPGTRLASDGMPILCTLYQAPAGVVRCDHYRGDGVCAVHAAGLMECTEWRLRNPEAPTPEALAPAPGESSAPSAGTLPLFGGDGAPLSPPTSSRRATRAPAAAAVVDRDDVAVADPGEPRPSPPGLTEADVESFDSLRVEMCITGPMGDVWIVPELKDPSRVEMTPRHAATVAWFVHTFGTQVAEVHRLNAEAP
jgi:hypothetical protein